MRLTKNDYRRTLIMLRGMEKGYSGHARLETRVMTGTLNVTVNASTADESLCAALIGRRGGRLTGIQLGQLREDARGQKGLLASFDPRNIAGMELSAVIAAVIVRTGGGETKPVLYGWVNGSARLDFDELRALLPALCGGAALATAPEAEEKDDNPTAPPISEPEAHLEESQVSEADMASEERASAPAEESQVSETDPVFIAADTASEERAAAPAEELEAETATDAPPAGDELGLDMALPWPKEVEDLRALFLTRPAFTPFEMPGFVFVRAAMAEETRIDFCAVGIRAENGQVTGVCYAIPMPYSPEPPAGLEEAVWIGDSNRGWWVTVRDVPEA